ncbi:ankyrin repeat-containing domain protein [Mycena amicta]|nr:ankyrin repeat-containing domain protein [Mycena amicta]
MGRRIHTKPLHLAALAGDDDAVRTLLGSGASVNELDSAGRSAVMCGLAGDNWQHLDASHSPKHLQVLRTLVGDAQVSLYSLNAPQRAYRGVTPLGMAAWLDRADAVRVLLEESANCVSVDGTDAHGATPLMYAARDGRLDVVQLLLRHGACPDFEDSNHRTAVQFALPFPQVLWLCEVALRRHRLLVNSPSSDTDLFQLSRGCLPQTNIFSPPRASALSAARTNTLIEAIRAADVTLVHFLLFPATNIFKQPTLVNLPDEEGWSPIHHAASASTPSLDIFDALAAAGAVGALFTTHEQWSPLHCFAVIARGRRPPVDTWRAVLSRFIGPGATLKTPLDAKDVDEETCLHLAAERGTSVELLALLLECDEDGRVRAMRNTRGLTPMEVCRPELRAAFGRDLDEIRSGSAMSCRTIRGSSHSGSLASLGSSRRPDVVPEENEHLSDAASVLDNVDISASAEQLLANLRLTSPTEPHSATPFHLNVLSNLVREAEDLSVVVVAHYRAAAVEAGRDVRGLREAAGRAQMRVERVGRDVEAKMRERGVMGAVRRRFDRGSEDSGVTAVSVEAAAWPDRSAERVGEVLAPVDCNKPAPVVVVVEEEPLVEIIEPAPQSLKRQTGTMKLKAWMKRKLQVPDTAVQQPERPKLEVIPEQQEVVVEPVVFSSPPPSPVTVEDDFSADAWVDSMLKSSHSTLEAASRDLERIRESIASAEHFISIVDRSAARVERVVVRALKKRETAISKLRATSTSSASENDDFFVRPGLLSPKSSVASLSSVYSARSSCLSLAATLSEQDDDDTRVIRRLLLRKIETGANGAREELEKGVSWLRTVKEVVRGAKQKAHV